MNALLKKIYENILIDEEYSLKLRKQIDDDVGLRFLKYRELLGDDEFETLKSDIFASCYVAELVGFEMGVRFMKRL